MHALLLGSAAGLAASAPISPYHPPYTPLRMGLSPAAVLAQGAPVVLETLFTRPACHRPAVGPTFALADPTLVPPPPFLAPDYFNRKKTVKCVLASSQRARSDWKRPCWSSTCVHLC